MTLRQVSDIISYGGVVREFDKICSFFNKRLHDRMIDELVDVVLDILGRLELHKEYDKILTFTSLLKDKQTKLYNRIFCYIDDFPIKYYAFHDNKEMVAKSFENFIKNPEQDYDQFLIYFNYLMFYGYKDVLRKAIEEVSETLSDFADYPLLICEYFLALSDYYENEKYERESFKRYMTDKHSLTIDEDLLDNLEMGFYGQLPEKIELTKMFKSNREKGVGMLRMNFVKHMYDKGFNTCLAALFWNNLQEIWDRTEDKHAKIEKYFTISKVRFIEQIEDIIDDYFGCNEKEVAATLWGCVYVYDYLKEIGLISAKIYDDFLRLTNKVKSDFIVDNIGNLWIYNFVHTWAKPSGISEIEFEAEHSLFKKTYDLKHEDNEVFFMETEKELRELGDMGTMIIEASHEKAKASEFSFYDDEEERIEVWGKFSDDEDEFDDDDDDFDEDYDDDELDDDDEYDDYDEDDEYDDEDDDDEYDDYDDDYDDEDEYYDDEDELDDFDDED